MDASTGVLVIAVVLALPLLAWFASRLLVKGGGETFSFLSRMPLKKWQGSYYAFNDIQVRVLEDEGRLWFVAKDVLQAVEMKGLPDTFLATYPDEARMLTAYRLVALDSNGVRKLLGRRNEHEPIRFLQWMEREVLKPWERKRERAKLGL